MDYLVVILAGLISGFVASAPIGPINLLIAEYVMDHRGFDLNAFLVGVIFIDLVFAALAFFGYHKLLLDTSVENWLIFAGGIFVIALGIIGLLKKEGGKVAGFRVKRPSKLAQFIKGVLLCGTNPAFLLFWIFVAGQINLIIQHEIGTIEILILLIAIGSGTSLWFYLYIKLLKKGLKRFNFSILTKIRKGISVSLILLGSAALFLMI